MIRISIGDVFVGDVVTCKGNSEYPVLHAKIWKFIKVVSS